MDHRALLRTLSPEIRQALLLRSDLAGLRHLAGHWGAIFLVSMLIMLRIPYWPLLLPLQGVLLIFNFTLLHECTHQTPFRSPWLNEVIGQITGFTVGLPFLWFRYFHFAHHKHTNNPAKDPELLGHPKPSNWRGYLWYISGLPVWWGQISGLFYVVSGQDPLPLVPKSMRRKVRVQSGIHALFYILIVIYSVTTSTVLFNLWIFPVFLGQPFLRLYLLAEHGHCPPVSNMLENSRTTLTLWPLRVLAWNMPYHAEHHTIPNIPFFRLPEFHKLIKTQLLTVENGYVRFHRAYVEGFYGVQTRKD